MNKIIFGGGFDPIHLGHINMAKIASEKYDADVIFVPAKNAIWKNSITSSIDKLEMLKLVIKNYDRFYIDTYELDKKDGYTYTVDTLKYIKSKYPNDEIYLLIGSDQVNKFNLWRSPHEISALSHIIYFKRPNIIINKDNIKEFEIEEIDGELIDVSSSDIKNLKSLKIDIKIRQYIEEHNLYYINKVRSYLDEKRFEHSLSVAHLAYDIAVSNKNGLEEKAYIAGLLHDIGKNYQNKESVVVEHYHEFINYPHFAYHQFVGEYLAKNDFGIEDESILKAIKYHATGNKDMDTLAKIIYAADKIDPKRGYDSSYMIEVMKKDVDEGFRLVLSENKKYLLENKKNIENVLSSACFKAYLK